MRLTASRPTHRHAWQNTVAVSAFAALFLFTLVAVSNPQSALGYTHTTRTPLCDGVTMRTKPSSTAARKATIKLGATVKVISTVKGGSWSSACTGKRINSTYWHKISRINGKTVSSLYGVTYVYAAANLFKVVSETKVAACDGVSLRTSARTSATRKAVIGSGSSVLSYAVVSGGSWKASCAGQVVQGSSWYRIKYVNNKSATSLYGVTYVYAASGLFKSVTSASTPTPTPPPGTTLTEGIDVSHWQGTIDWTKVRAAGKKFAYIKASEHTSFVDDKYATNRSKAKAAGLKVGAYHFARPSTEAGDAVAEANHFINTAQPVSGELIPVLDLEQTGGLGTTALVNWTKAFLQRVYDRTGVRAAIYVSPSFWSSKLGNTNWFANNGYKVLWIAHWTTGSSPTVPADNWGSQGWTFWQYTSDGSVSGIGGRVDLNRYRGTDFTKVLIP